MSNEGKIIPISLGGSIINPGSIDRDFLQAFRELVIRHLEKTADKFIIICGGGKVARDYISASPEGMAPGQKDLTGIMTTWVNAQLIASWFQGYTPTKPSQDFYNFVNQIDSYRVLVAGGFLPGIKTDEDAALCADYFKSPYLINVTNVDGVYNEDPRKNPHAKRFNHLSYKEFINLIQNEDVGPGASAPYTLIATKIAERSNCRLLIVKKDISAIKQAIEGINVGTEISNSSTK